MQPIGLILRLVGPLLELGLFWALVQVRGQNYRVLGIAAETWIWTGILICICLIVVGIFLSRTPREPRDVRRGF